MDIILVLVIVAVAVAGLATYFYISSSRGKRETGRLVPTPVISKVKLKPAAVVPPAVVRAVPPRPAPAATPPLFDLDLDLNLEPAFTAPPPVEIRWCKGFDPRSATLDDVARLRLIGDLGVVGKEWCVPLLAQAYEEERRPGHRQAALTALAACHSRAAAATFRSALQSNDPSERAIAADGLADLEPPPQTKPRRIVERH